MSMFEPAADAAQLFWKTCRSIDLDQDIAAISVGRMPSMLCFVFVFLLHDVF
ncbi:hypothetical protein ULF88_06635 [Halopseudomonas pachastrellae]|nr:hypothetical protein [Halopseudomonas pachastrellae]